jgi:hypothetical protein
VLRKSCSGLSEFEHDAVLESGGLDLDRDQWHRHAAICTDRTCERHIGAPS